MKPNSLFKALFEDNKKEKNVPAAMAPVFTLANIIISGKV